ncbi:MAG: UvrD-helicase domain-containing protein, partial [Bacilli bacterium]|nr:UvrD-helicase domain-containing protein [Bacilli bacterium]
MKDFEYEKEKLKKILEKYVESLEEIDIRVKRLPETYRDNPILLANLLSVYENKLRLMKEGQLKPYFARIDFKEDGKENISQCYLGKVGISDSDNNIITVDWRAPIASMYYDSNVGLAIYEAPAGTITGELLIKRQIDIESGELQRIQDVDTVSNDEILKPYLGVTADNRLKNIVSTIQSEQNEIIRENIKTNMIIQGVAGSGKTTVALHRIAYLVYNHQKKINPDQYMVIGPNKFFLDYISSVLPDLDASQVSQLTFEELVKDYIEEDILINSAEKQLVDRASTNDKNLAVSKFKNSLKYKEALDKYIMEFDDKVVQNNDFIVKGITILPQLTMKLIYDEADKNRYLSIYARIKRAVLVASSYIENHSEIIDEVSADAFNANQKSNEFIKKEIRNRFNQSLKQYYTKLAKKSATSLYSDFIKNVNKYIDSDDKDLLKQLKDITLKNIKEKSYDFDDLAALAYIQYCLRGTKGYNKYHHVVIDEAQDYGDFNFEVLKNMMNKASFSIYGDIAQSIYSYRSIENWDSVIKVFNDEIEVKELLKSYRTTIEVMNEANHIINHIGLSPALPVIRNGDEVGYIEVKDNKTDIIYDYILSYLEKGHNSIAVITKTSDEANNIHEKLIKNGINIECITTSENKYSGGICVTTSYL